MGYHMFIPPHSIIVVLWLEHDKHWKFIFIFYVEYHYSRKITNNVEDQIVSGIFLVRTANFQEGYKKFSLRTGRVVTCKQNISEIPIPTWVIWYIEALATRDGRDLAEGD